MRMTYGTSGALLALLGWLLVCLIGMPGVAAQAPLTSPAGLIVLILPVLILMGLGEGPSALALTILAIICLAVLQWQSHWAGYFFGASPDAVLAHRSVWSGNWQLLPMAPGRTVPDGYHTVLALLLICAFLSAVRDLLRR